jgi:hypothetical protein
MFNCIFNKKNKVFIDKLEKYVIKCDHDGVIIDINEETLILLLYEKQNIINKFIGILMSPFMNYLHKNVLLPKYKEINNIQKNIAHIFLSALSVKRPLIIYNILKEPIYISLSVIFTKYGFNICFSVNNEINNENIYTKNIISTNKSENFKLTKNKLVIIAIDFINSTETLVNDGVLNYIDINKRFHRDIINKIKKYYYPYIYIHEIIGDMFIIILNADWTFNITKYTTSLALSFIIQLIKKTNDYVNIRCGIVYDNLYYGYIDHNLRLFGEAINKASRLESTCKGEYEINCDNNFLQKLLEENIYNKNNLTIQYNTTNLKGFGMTSYNSIEIKKNIYNNDDDIFTTIID